MLKNLYEISKRNLWDCDAHFDGKLHQLKIVANIYCVSKSVLYSCLAENCKRSKVHALGIFKKGLELELELVANPYPSPNEKAGSLVKQQFSVLQLRITAQFNLFTTLS